MLPAVVVVAQPATVAKKRRRPAHCRRWWPLTEHLWPGLLKSAAVVAVAAVEADAWLLPLWGIAGLQSFTLNVCACDEGDACFCLLADWLADWLVSWLAGCLSPAVFFFVWNEV